MRLKLAGVLALLSLVLSPGLAEALPPVAVTEAYTDLTASAVKIRGAVYHAGEKEISAAWFDLTPPGGQTVALGVAPDGPGRYWRDLRDLPAGTYTYVFHAANQDGAGAGKPFKFTVAGAPARDNIERDYEWYFSQAEARVYADINCGPAVAAMAAKWYSPRFSGTVEDVRFNVSRSRGFYLSDIRDYLKNIGVDIDYSYMFSPEFAKLRLDEKKIMIVGINWRHISHYKDEVNTTTRIRPADAGHALIIKGMSAINGVDYFEVYDPGGSGYKAGGVPKGKNRYFRADEITRSVYGYSGGEYITVNPPK